MHCVQQGVFPFRQELALSHTPPSPHLIDIFPARYIAMSQFTVAATTIDDTVPRFTAAAARSILILHAGLRYHN